MKRIAALLMTLLLLCCSLAQGQGDLLDEQTAAAPGENGFSILCPASAQTEWDEANARLIVRPIPGADVPALYVSRYMGTGFAPEAHFEFLTEDLHELLGDRFIAEGTYQPYTVAGKQLWGVCYRYSALTGQTLNMLRVFDVLNDSIVMYTLDMVEGDEAQLAMLSQAVAGFLPNGSPQPVPTQPKQQPVKASLGAFSLRPAAPIVSQTEARGDWRYTVTLPKGWTVVTGGEYTTFHFLAYDPQAPDRKLFYMTKVQPMLKSQRAKDFYLNSARLTMGDVYGYGLVGAFPVMEPSTAGFLRAYEAARDVCWQYRGQTIMDMPAVSDPEAMPDLHNVEVLETWPNSTPVTPNCLDNSIARIRFTSDQGTACMGLAAAQATDFFSLMDPGFDVGYYGAYSFMGVAAPEDELAELEPVLQQCLCSFSFTQAYVDATKQSTEETTKAILAMNGSMQAAYDSYNSAWRARQTAYDVSSQKSSDATLGYDRLYDPDTGETYRAELGFYDSYDLNRSAFDKPNLQLVDTASQDYYLKPVDYYITK